MAKITGRVYDVGLDGARGTMWLSAGFRAGTGGVVAPRRVAWPITDGDLPDNVIVEPGPAFLEIDVGVSARLEKPVVIPDEDVTLADLVSTVYDWTPQEVAEFVRLRDEAVAAAEDAAGHAEDAAGSAAAAAGSASAAASSASDAAGSAASASSSAGAAASDASAAAGSASAAASSASDAAGSASAAASSASTASAAALVITDNLDAITAAPGAAEAAGVARDAAEGHATAAGSSASSASSSASDAAGHASDAASSATVASGHASDAADSATAAAGSAAAAASSVTSAEGHATTAAGHAGDAAASATAAATDADRARQYAEEFDLSMSAVTGDPGTQAQVVVSGDGPAYEVALTVPQGEKGDPGPPGEVSQAALDAALSVKADLVDGKVPESQLPELGGSTDASLLTGALTDQVDASAAIINYVYPGEPTPSSTTVEALAESTALALSVAIDLSGMIQDKSDVGHTHTADEVGAVANEGGAAGLWVGTESTLPTTGTAGVLYVTTED